MSGPKIGQQFRSLLVADFTTQLRRGRSMFLSLLLPVVLLFAWRRGIGTHFSGAFLVSSALSISLITIGFTGYALSLAQDRALGVFQRIRVTPTPTWAVMVSRLTVALVTILLAALIVIIGGRFIDQVSIGPGAALVTMGVSLIAGAVFLAGGQLLTALVTSADAVNAASRVIYIVLILGGMLGSFGVLGPTWKSVVDWSPYGTVQIIVQAAAQGTLWTTQAWQALAATIGYILIFTILGIRYFRWNVE